jgi:hypothetical protein
MDRIFVILEITTFIECFDTLVTLVTLKSLPMSAIYISLAATIVYKRLGRRLGGDFLRRFQPGWLLSRGADGLGGNE